jgi:hypothetical protein
VNIPLLLTIIPLALVVGLGCSGKPLNIPPEAIVEKPWANVGEAFPSHDGDVDAVAGLSEVLAGKLPTVIADRPLNVLVMSGGGKYGAFTAGALAGWTKSGTRPTFDVATGISSGAITAALAFIGPKNDEKLTKYFTTLHRSDLFTWQPIRGLISGRGLMSPEPLERTIESEVNDEFMSDLRAAHTAGRRLYIGTGNLLTNRLAVWDLGAIACSGRPDATVLVRKILLASCCVPGAVRPVEIEIEVNGVRYNELHGDAGNFAQAFVRTPAGLPAGSNIWVLSAGKVYRDQLRKQPSVVRLLGAGISNSLYSLFRADLVKLYGLCAVTHSHFNLLFLPPEFRAETSSAAFDPEELTRMYWLGYQLAAGKGEWHTTPPDTLPGEENPPRTGVQFLTPK